MVVQSVSVGSDTSFILIWHDGREAKKCVMVVRCDRNLESSSKNWQISSQQKKSSQFCEPEFRFTLRGQRDKIGVRLGKDLILQRRKISGDQQSLLCCCCCCYCCCKVSIYLCCSFFSLSCFVWALSLFLFWPLLAPFSFLSSLLLFCILSVWQLKLVSYFAPPFLFIKERTHEKVIPMDMTWMERGPQITPLHPQILFCFSRMFSSLFRRERWWIYHFNLHNKSV